MPATLPAQFFDKFPDEIVEFDFDASTILINGNTIANVEVVPISAGLTIPSSAFSGSTITFKAGGGVAGKVAHAVAQVTLADGQYREGPVSILIKRLPTS